MINTPTTLSYTDWFTLNKKQIVTLDQSRKIESGYTPVFEGEHDGKQASAGVSESLVAAG